MKKIEITAEYVGERFDRFLLNVVPGVSRSQLQKAIVSGIARVNGEIVTKHRFLKTGDVVEFDDVVLGAAAAPIPGNWWDAVPDETNAEGKIEVIFEDDAILVVNKPSGLVVHPADERDRQPSLASWFLARMVANGVAESPEEWIALFPEQENRPGIVHRLDKPVTGVLVLAKTPEALQKLQEQFQARTVDKEYRAVVYGVPPQETGEIKFAIARSKTRGGKMAARPQHEIEDSKQAWTTYQLLRNIHDRYAELSVRIHTGRTHQIRAHLAAIDHPVVGDLLYGSRRYPQYKKSERLFLHSLRLAFTHPTTRKPVEYTAELPEWFSQF